MRGREAATRPAEGLAQRGGQDVHSPHDSTVLRRAPARRAKETGGVAVVDHHQCAVALGQVADLDQLGHVAVHREDAVGGDEPRPRAACLLQAALELDHVAVTVAQARRLAQANAVDDRGVIETVRDHRVFLAQQGLE